MTQEAAEPGKQKEQPDALLAAIEVEREKTEMEIAANKL